VTREYLARVGVARALVAFPLGPASIVASIRTATSRLRFAGISRPAPEGARLVIAVAREGRWPAPLVVSFVVAVRAASPAAVACGSTVFVA
jgi:hypothetical protein